MEQKYLVGQMVNVSFEGIVDEAYRVGGKIYYKIAAENISAIGLTENNITLLYVPVDNNITPIEGVDNVTSGQ